MLTLPLVVHITLRSENTNGDTCVVECTADSVPPGNRTARVALRALFAVLYLSVHVVFETLRVYVQTNEWECKE